MQYFIELYDSNQQHIGTRSLRAVTEGDAADEICALLRSINNSYTTARLFEQPPLANYREIAVYSLFASHTA